MFRTVGLLALVPLLVATAGDSSDPSDDEPDEALYATRVWEGPNGGSMNLSSFVFRDLDRSGRYDLGDRPHINIAVELTEPDGTTRIVRTNNGGFANFPASLMRDDGLISGPGLHMVRVIPPPGWTVTTDNAVQSLDVSVLEGAPGDLVADGLPDPVGLAPDPAIIGTVSPADDGPLVTATGADGSVVTAEPDVDGAYRLAVSPGRWTVDDGIAARTVDVGPVAVVLPGPDLLVAADEHGSETGAEAVAGSAVAAEADGPAVTVVIPTLPAADGVDATAGGVAGEHVTIGFDDLLASDSLTKIPLDYHGLGWHNVVAIHNRFSGQGYINNTMSGEFVAYTSSGHPSTVDSDVPFDFVGTYVGLAWARAEGETLRVRAWRGDQLVHDDALTLSSYGPVYFAADYRAITRLEFSTDHYWQAVLDDLHFVVRTG